MRVIGPAVVLAVSLALVPLAAEAQQANQLRRIGVLMHNAQNDPESTTAASSSTIADQSMK